MKRAVLITNYLADESDCCQAAFDLGFYNNLCKSFFTTIAIYRDKENKYTHPLLSDRVVSISSKKSSYLNLLFIFKMLYSICKLVIKNDVIVVKLFQIEGFVAAFFAFIFQKKYYVILVGDPEKSLRIRSDIIRNKLLRNLASKLVYYSVAIAIYKSSGTAFVSNQLKKRYGFSRKFVVASESWLKKDDFNNSLPTIYSYYQLDRPINLVYVGRLVLEKGLDVLVRAISILKNSGIKISLTFVGTGKDYDYLMELSRKVNININFTGYVPSNSTALFDLYRKSDVFILPSYSEGLPLSILEAQASKTFVVASDVGGISEVIKPGKTGYLLKAIDTDSIISSIHYVINNEDDVSLMIDNAFEEAKTRLFDIEQNKIYSLIT